MCMFVEGTNEEVMAGGVEGRGFESPDGIKGLNASSVGKKMKRRESWIQRKHFVVQDFRETDLCGRTALISSHFFHG